MSTPLKAAFLFIAPGGSPSKHKACVTTDEIELMTYAVSNYKHAESLARYLVEHDGIGAIELCGGFGHEGAARIAKAVDVPVGVVRFDVHPGLGGKSGDSIWGGEND
ncbi:DUF6506 family protein [Desulfobaculum sp. SPO524]|uniref:DUF6506 family protein n=1 Tax=Desulfobaculum sp. SPO524 TaxID=3378071 RepID=UPI0038539F13